MVRVGSEQDLNGNAEQISIANPVVWWVHRVIQKDGNSRRRQLTIKIVDTSKHHGFGTHRNNHR